MNAFLGLMIIFLLMGGLFSIMSLFNKIKSKSEKKDEELLKKSLEEEYIIDPDTGIKLTLEEAESGQWIAHDNEFLTVPESEIENYDNEDNKTAERALNYLKESKAYRTFEFSDQQFDIISNSEILKQLNDWTYSNLFIFKQGLLIIVNSEFESVLGTYTEPNLMFWVKLKNIEGHYYFREKTSAENFLDYFKNDDEFSLIGYECFTIKKTYNVILMNKILSFFENQFHIIVELRDDNLFIKTTRLINIDDIKRVENIINQIVK